MKNMKPKISKAMVQAGARAMVLYDYSDRLAWDQMSSDVKRVHYESARACIRAALKELL